MSSGSVNDPLLEMFIFETTQLTEQLEQSILASEKHSCYTQEAINEIFRIMHTIKGSSAMMGFCSVSAVAHAIEDIFYFLREEKPENTDCSSLSDLILESIDFIKIEIEKIKSGSNDKGDSEHLTERLKSFLSELKSSHISTPTNPSTHNKTYQDNDLIIQNKGQNEIQPMNDILFRASMFFQDGCEMENIRAYAVINNLKNSAYNISHTPKNLIDDDNSANTIKKEGFTIFFNSRKSYTEIYDLLMETVFLKDLNLIQLKTAEELEQFNDIMRNHGDNTAANLHNCNSKTQGVNISTCTQNVNHDNNANKEKESFGISKPSTSTHQNVISVSVAKLDKLMDLVGEMVISEAMVVQNPDLNGLHLENFYKAARQLNKITNELQHTVMSIRMVPLSATFLKMHRIVRDICRQEGKEVELKVIGEETEVDKNVIERISDPIMHLVRNAIDHGIEYPEERMAKGKPAVGTITLEAKNSGSDVLIIVRDNGKGLNKEKVLEKARTLNLIYKSEDEMTDKEIYNMVFFPGFSTKESITELSGRGVGMDVVSKNIEAIGGSVSIDSTQDDGTTITIKIPLTLAIIDGMNIRVGSSCYTIPTISISESFRPKDEDVFTDPDGNEMIMVRGQCYPILRLYKIFKNKTNIIKFSDGVITMIEQDSKTICIFSDELIGQQSVVVKALPEYIRKFRKTKGLAGCTLLGDGKISLILDIASLMQL